MIKLQDLHIKETVHGWGGLDIANPDRSLFIKMSYAEKIN